MAAAATCSHEKNVSPLRYPGGKTRAIKIIAEQITRRFGLPCRGAHLISPFFGGGSVELAMTCAPYSMHVLANDLFEPLINFWSVLRQDSGKLRKACARLRPMSRESFAAARDRLEPHADASCALGDMSQTLIARAADYFAINRSSFSGATYCGGFSQEASRSRFNESSIARLGAVRLENVTFSCEDGVAFIRRQFDTEGKSDAGHTIIDRARDLMYLDPPYYVANYIYGRNGDLHRNFDHVKLRDTLRDIAWSRWILSYNDCPYIRELYGDARAFEITTAAWSYGMNASKKSSELLIYPINSPRIKE